MENSSPKLPIYFTAEEVAASLRVTERTVYGWLQAGELQGVKAGKYWRVSQEALNDFLKVPRGRGGKRKKPTFPLPGAVVQAVVQAEPAEVKPSPSKGKTGRRR
jgi:excisionase family DNA binding protein